MLGELCGLLLLGAAIRSGALAVVALLLAITGLRLLRLHPRKVLDIGWQDIFAAVQFSLFPFSRSRDALESSIKRQWSKDDDSIVCLCVRSGIDLVLAALDLPKNSEVLFAPGITIPSVVQIVESHGLQVRSYEPPDEAAGGLLPAPDSLPVELTENTRVLIITHLFGAVLDAGPLIREARSRGIFIIEDCAQAFVGATRPGSRYVEGRLGEAGFRGHTEADASFVSFGLIKTQTALGGALGRIPDAQLRRRVEEMQGKYPSRSRRQFLATALKAGVLKLIARPYIWGLTAALAALFGIDFDALIVGSVRGFPKGTGFRLRPSLALLQLLHRRLHRQREAGIDSVCMGLADSSLARRRDLGERVARQLREGGVRVLADVAGAATSWLVPVLDEDPRGLVRALWAQGFDATCTATQLGAVASVAKNGAKGGALTELMRRVVYLPVTPDMSPTAADALAIAVLDARQRRGVARYAGGSSLSWWRGARRGLAALSFALVLALRPSAFAWMLPSRTLLGALTLTTLMALALLSMVARRLANTPGLRVGREIFAALRPRERPEGLAALAAAPPTSGARVDGAVLLTGATGFVGGGILFALLAQAEKLGVTRVVLLIRSKGGKSAQERLQELRASPFLLEVQEAFDRLCTPLEGDAAEEGLGWPDALRPWPHAQEPLKVVLHCAGDVRFDQPLQQASVSLISATLQAAALASRWGAQRFIFVSTAFVHGVPSHEKCSEELVSLQNFDPMELYRDAVSDGRWAEKAMRELRFPNTYTFSKAIAEHLVMQTCKASAVEAYIVRPSIVGPAWAFPCAGWCGDRPSTIVAGAVLLQKRAVRLFRASRHPTPLVPVDLVARVALEAIAAPGSTEVKGRVVNAAVDASEADRVPSFHSILTIFFQILALRGEASLPETGFLLRLLSWANDESRFRLLHSALNVAPAVALSRLCSIASGASRLLGMAPEPWARRHSHMKALMRYASLPMQYAPFSSPARAWTFGSSLRLPVDWEPIEYTVLIMRAANDFAQSINGKGAPRRGTVPFHNLRLCPRRPAWLQLVLSLASPGAPLHQCVAAFLIHLGLAWADLKVTVDASSLNSLLQLDHHYVLCPTHRSLLDFVILGLACFQLRPFVPVLKVPHVAADSEFKTLPLLGRPLAALGAFFVRRGGGGVQPDPGLRAELQRALRQGWPLEVFLEGLRSRGRRHLRLRTGFLRALREVSQEPLSLVPVALSYELLPEDQTFYDELRGSSRRQLNTLSLATWAWSGLRGELPPLGDAHLRVGGPRVLEPAAGANSGARLGELLGGLQEQMITHTRLTTLHVRALAEVLELPSNDVLEALSGTGVEIQASRLEKVVLSEAERWSLALQAAVQLRSQLPPRWANWLVEPQTPERCEKIVNASGDAVPEPAFAKDAEPGCEGEAAPSKRVAAALSARLGAAEAAARRAAAELSENAGGAPLSEGRLVQQLLRPRSGEDTLPPALARGAACIVAGGFAATFAESASKNSACVEGTVAPLWPAARRKAEKCRDEEALGRWGYRDTRFVAQWVDGRPAVKVTSMRYGSIGGRPMTELWALFQRELGIVMDVRDTLPPRPTPSLPAPAEGLTERLAGAASGAQVITDAEARLRAGSGHGLNDVWRLRCHEVGRMPDAVVRPSSEDDVVAVLAAAAGPDGFAVVPVGGGTNVTSATACPDKEVDPRPFVALDMRSLAAVRWVNQEDGLALVDAGITGSALKEALAREGVTMGMEPDSMEFSTLGGWIATRASGMKRARYGNIEDMLVEVRVATPSGLLCQPRPGASGDEETAFGRSSMNMALPGLLLGSEGCLGVVTAAIVRVRPLPECVEHQSIIFQDWAQGAAWMREVARLPASLRPASCRLMDSGQLRLARALAGDGEAGMARKLRAALKAAALHLGGVRLESAAAATVLFEGAREEVATQRTALSRLVRRAGGLWGGSSSGKAGYALTFAIAYLRDFGLDYRILSESLETLAPWSRVSQVWPAVVAAVEAEHTALRLPGRPFLSCRMTQIYDEGVVLYMYLAVSTSGFRPDRAIEAFERLEQAARTAALQAGSCLSHHHGVGKHRAKLLTDAQAPVLSEVMHGIKAALDPSHVLAARNGAWAGAP